MQPSEQHSVEVVQLAAAGEHCATVELHVCASASHRPEQQSPAAWHTAPNAPHVGA
jgi:hypothetical protein